MGIALTDEKIEEVMRNYSRIAWRTVHRYRKTKRLSHEDTQDLHQECMVKMVEHLNKCSEEKEIYSLQIMNLVNAMTKYLMRGSTFTGTQSTANFREFITAQPESIPLSELFDSALEEEAAMQLEEYIVTKIDLERFLETLTEKQRNVVLKKLSGYRNTEIAEKENVTKTVVTRHLDAIHKKYDRYNAESKDE